MATTNANPLEESKARLTELQQGLNARFNALSSRASRTAGEIRDTGLGLAYSTSAAALDIGATLGRSLPFTKTIAERLEKQAGTMTERQSALARPQIDDYDELNVKQVADELEDLGPWELEKVRRYEQEHKNRKTVLGAVERMLGDIG